VAQFDVDAINVESLRQRTSVKWRTFDPDVLPAWVAEMDFPLAAEVAAALHAAIDRSDTGYRSLDGLAESLVRFADDSWSWQFSRDDVFCAPDVLSAIAHSLSVLTRPGEAVVINPPVYHPFFPVVREVVGRGLVEVPMARADDGSYGWDLPALEQAFARPEVTAYLLSSPHNPTGSVPSRETLEAISLMASTHGVSVVADEIHASLVLPGAVHVPYLSVATPEASAVSVLSASKAWNLPGLKCAQAVASPAIATRITATLPMSVSFGIGHLGVLATMAAYRDGAPWLGEVIAILDGNRRLLGDLLAEHLPRVRYTAPAATYLAWLDLRDYGLGDDPAEALLARGRVALSDGPSFGTQGRGFARLNFATSPAILREIVERMATVVQ
jgi:cystathionine beta-lyase